MKSVNVEMPMMGLLNNYDGVNWRVKEMAEMLASAEARAAIWSATWWNTRPNRTNRESWSILKKCPTKARHICSKFVAELATALHAADLKLMVALPARDDAYDYGFFGKQCDAIVLMNYDQHWLTSPPGPIAAQDWYVENLRQVLKVVPAQKIMAAVGNYAYDWSQAPKKKRKRPNR